MRYDLRKLRAALVVAPLFAFPLIAQAPDEVVFGDRVEVELVLVDVFVATKDGSAVTDLGVEDFRVFHDGTPVAINQFTPARSALAQRPLATTVAAATPAPSRTAGSDLPRRLVIFLDNLHLHPNSRARLMRGLFDDLREHLTADDEVMVVAYGGGPTEVLLPMTRDRGALKRVFKEQAESGAVSLLASYDDLRILDIIERRHSEETLTSGVVAGDPCVDLGYIAHSHAQQVQGRVLGTIYELDRFVSSLAGYEGRKVLLHVSDGIPLVPGAEAYRYASELCDGTGVIKGIENAVDTATFGSGQGTRWNPTQTAATLQEFNTADEWTRLAGQANTYQVSFYMYQAHMATAGSASADRTRTSVDTEMEGRRNKQDALFLLADETGGRALLDSNDIERALVQMTEDWSAGYQLAYAPPNPGDGRQHRIRVEVDRPGVRLRHRKSYLSKSPDERIADRVVSTLLHGTSAGDSALAVDRTNPLGIRLRVEGQTPAERGVTNVRLRVQVPLSGLVLLPDAGVRRGLFTVFVAASGGHGQLTPVGQKAVPLRVPVEGAEPEYVYSVEIPIRGDGGYVAIAVQDQLGGEISFVRERVRVLSSS